MAIDRSPCAQCPSGARPIFTKLTKMRRAQRTGGGDEASAYVALAEEAHQLAISELILKTRPHEIPLHAKRDIRRNLLWDVTIVDDRRSAVERQKGFHRSFAPVTGEHCNARIKFLAGQNRLILP